jgi:hypothetical protein
MTNRNPEGLIMLHDEAGNTLIGKMEVVLLERDRWIASIRVNITVRPVSRYAVILPRTHIGFAAESIISRSRYLRLRVGDRAIHIDRVVLVTP